MTAPEPGVPREAAAGKRPGVLVEHRGPVALVTLNNPAKRNALNPDLLVDLIAALGGLSGKPSGDPSAESPRVVIFRGAGEKSFCSGFDIAAIPTRIPPAEFAERSPRNLVQEMIGLVEAFPVPTIAMINGHAWGAGCELATACDLRVAVGDATFGMPPARLGIIYSPVGLSRFIRLIGVANTKEMFLTARAIDAPRALAMGLVSHVVPRAELEPFVLSLASDIAANAPLAVRGMKRVIGACTAHALSPEEEAEAARLIAQSFASEDLVEGQAAFLEGRKPAFRGR